MDHPHTPTGQAIESFANILKPPPTAGEPWHYIKGGAYDRTLAEGVTYYQWQRARPPRQPRHRLPLRDGFTRRKIALQ